MNRLLLTFVILSFVIRHSAHSAVVFSGIQNVAIPLDFNGVYLNPYSGVTTTAYPADWNTAPWINPFFGGVGIANDALLRSVITGADQVLNLALGTTIDATSNFVAGESGSSTHVGPALNQFQLSTPGLIGFTFQPTIGGNVYYGWASVTIENTSAGTIHSWAWENTPDTGILAGDILGIPEPTRALLLLLGLMGAVMRRRRAWRSRSQAETAKPQAARRWRGDGSPAA